MELICTFVGSKNSHQIYSISIGYAIAIPYTLQGCYFSNDVFYTNFQWWACILRSNRLKTCICWTICPRRQFEANCRTAMPMHRDWTMNVNVYYTQQSIINIFELMIPLSEMSMLRWQIRYICRRFIGTRQSFIIFGMGFGCVYVVHLNSHRPLNVYILLANCAIVIQ